MKEADKEDQCNQVKGYKVTSNIVIFTKTMKEADKDGKINEIRSKVTRSPVIMSY